MPHETELFAMAPRTASTSSATAPRRHGATVVLVGEHELAFSLAHHALLRLGCDDDTADAAITEARRQHPPPAVGAPTNVS